MASTTTQQDVNLQQIHDFLTSLAKEAGSLITSATPTTDTSGSKKNSVDLVTATDRAVEQFVSTSIQSTYPSYSFIGEETYTPNTILTAEPTFIVDPIDGTTNFIHGCYTNVCISLGFTLNKVPTVGVVYNPFTGEMYTAIKDGGSYLHNLKTKEKLKLPLRDPEPLQGLAKALVILEWGSDREGKNFDIKVDTFRKLAASEAQGGKMVHNIRSFGSAALNFCKVAEGGCDVYWEGGCWAWDVCAAWVVLTEAGGLVADGNPGNGRGWEPTVDGRRYIAVRGGEGNKELVEELWGVIVGDMEY